MIRSASQGAALAAALLLCACDGSSPTPQPTPSPTPTPTSTTVTYVVEPCFTQAVQNTGGLNLRSMIIPDTLKLDLSRPSGFPNGRDLDDPVVDILLAMLFLDSGTSGQSILTFANLPLNPPGNDRPFTATFPFLAPPQGTPPLAATTGTSFDFRTDPETSYVQVDRMGVPAVATALIGSPLKNAYNDVGPTADTAGTFLADETAQLTNLMRAIGDDLDRIGLEICADT